MTGVGREPGPVTSLDDLAVRFSATAGTALAEVEVVDTRTGRVLLALTPDQAATLAGSVGWSAGRARAGLVEVHGSVS